MRYSILFQSTRPLRGATALVVSMSGRVRISIHAPLAGRDLTTFGLWAITPIFQSTRPLRGATSCALRLQSRTGISIHAPLAGRDDVDHSKLPPVVRFQSTRPLRGATDGETNNSAYGWNFNPRTPCGARHQELQNIRNRGDFNPRTPCGARLPRGGCDISAFGISIHAPLAGRDHTVFLRLFRLLISIHAPLAGRDYHLASIRAVYATFQSTHPLRGATLVGTNIFWIAYISIHAPLAGRDGYQQPMPRHQGHFNPRTPCGARPIFAHYLHFHTYFNPRTPCGARPIRGLTELEGHDFNPRTPCGARRFYDTC